MAKTTKVDKTAKWICVGIETGGAMMLVYALMAFYAGLSQGYAGFYMSFGITGGFVVLVSFAIRKYLTPKKTNNLPKWFAEFIGTFILVIIGVLAVEIGKRWIIEGWPFIFGVILLTFALMFVAFIFYKDFNNLFSE